MPRTLLDHLPLCGLGFGPGDFAEGERVLLAGITKEDSETAIPVLEGRPSNCGSDRNAVTNLLPENRAQEGALQIPRESKCQGRIGMV